MKYLLPILALALASGCARFTSKQVETIGTNGESTRTTTLKVTTFFDARSDVAKVRSSTTDKTQGLTVGGLSESSSGTNSVQSLRAIYDILKLVQ